jgi:integrase
LIELVEGIITDGKPIAANRVQALVSGIWSFAVDAGLVTANPFLRLRKRSQETAKTRTLTDDEIRLFWGRIVMPPVSYATGPALRLVLAVGCRPGEASGMTKAELAFDSKRQPVSWLIPAARSKNRRARFVPFAAGAAELVTEALILAGKSGYLFPSPTADQPINSHALSVAMARMAAALAADEPGVDTWLADRPTPHDLRRTCATRLAAAGVPGEDVAAVLGHVRTDVTGRHYDQYTRAKEKATALAQWGAELSAISGPPRKHNIVMLLG